MKFYGALFVLFFGAFTLYCVSVVKGADFDLAFEREARSELAPSALGLALHATSNWPAWFHSLKEAQVVDFQGKPYSLRDQVVMQGSLLRLFIEPPKKEWKRFEMTAEVTAFEPAKRLRIFVHTDSTGKLTEMFGKLEWEVELVPDGSGTRIVGRAFARTKSWRARLFGRLSERILMNQVFYPDVIGLAKITRPLGANPGLATDQ